MEMTILGILVFLMACIVIYMCIDYVIYTCVNYHRHKKWINDYVKNNQVKFYVARDKCTNILYLYLGKPNRYDFSFYMGDKGSIVAREDNFANFGLNPKDFENLKFEDEPVEVFLNLEN